MKENESEEYNAGKEKTRIAFEALMTTLEAYLAPLLTIIHTALLIDPIPQTVIILADDDLLEFPLECLTVFHKKEITTVARDFSLQFFYHRFKRGEIGM
jgi:hypothetical protein